MALGFIKVNKIDKKAQIKTNNSGYKANRIFYQSFKI